MDKSQIVIHHRCARIIKRFADFANKNTHRREILSADRRDLFVEICAQIVDKILENVLIGVVITSIRFALHPEHTLDIDRGKTHLFEFRHRRYRVRNEFSIQTARQRSVAVIIAVFLRVCRRIPIPFRRIQARRIIE